jgi:peroxiredoxin
MRTMSDGIRRVLACAILGAAAPLACAAPMEISVPTAAPAPEAGLAVGQRGPAFSLPDQNEHVVSLAELLKKGPVAVVFFRSADWCGYCKLQLVQLQKVLPEIEAAGGQVVGVSFDSTEVLHRFAQRGVSFPLLSDKDSAAIGAYGIRNEEAPPAYAGVSRHATFVLDRNGVIRSKIFQVSYAERPAVDSLLKALRAAR